MNTAIITTGNVILPLSDARNIARQALAQANGSAQLKSDVMAAKICAFPVGWAALADKLKYSKRGLAKNGEPSRASELKIAPISH